jgi:hypothetical protein
MNIKNNCLFSIDKDKSMGQLNKMLSLNAHNIYNKQVIEVTNLSQSPSSTNRVAAWRQQRNENETEAERKLRLEKELEMKINQRLNRKLSESPRERENRLQQEAIVKSNDRYLRAENETQEERETRLLDEAISKRTRDLLVRLLDQPVLHVVQ